MTYLVVSRLLDAFPEHYGKPGHGLLEAAHDARASMRELWNGAESLVELPPVAPGASPAAVAVAAWKAANGYDELLAACSAAQDKVVELQAKLAEAGKAQAEWVVETLVILDKLDHAETLHEDTMRFQYEYASNDLGAHLARHRNELRAALGLPLPSPPSALGGT